MGHIKSALEIALEKTEGIKGDKTALASASARDEGKRLASSFFENPSIDIGKKLKELPSEEIAWVKEGFLQVIMSNLVLPRDEKDLEKLEGIGKALDVIVRDRGKVKTMKEQLGQFFKQCLDDKKRLSEALVKQLAPMIRQKEAQLSQQHGRPVRIDPKADPEFAKAFNQNMGSLEQKYAEVLAGVKGEISTLIDFTKA